jgi:UDP-N-acetylmuramyl pentapeptide phosphotransferase/UDP-N-acetylglucosamine-1-phosphate transferase
LGAVSAWAAARLIAESVARRRSSLDTAGDDPRKIHVHPTPRVGGVAIVAGLAAGAVVQGVGGGDVRFWLLLALCAAPAFLWGLIEDVSKRGAILVRLSLTGTSAGLAFVLLDTRITFVDLPGLDYLLTFHALSFAFTVFAVTGVANAMNVIDGLNGLSGVTGLLAAAGLAVVAWIAGDPVVFSAACVLGASVAGFLLVNFPRGRIFLGDGGAYLMGLLLALLSVILVHRNSEVSPWFPLVLLAFPVWETLFSMYRRKRRGRSTGEADALHLHSLVYRRVVRWRGYAASAADCVTRNSLASLCLWVIPGLCFATALAFWDRSLVLQGAAVIFAACYVAIYRRIVRFQVPARLVVRPKPRAALKSLRSDWS